MIAERTTRYSEEVKSIMQRLGHATNVEIAEELRQKFPEVSDTTVHRITCRMAERGHLAGAPNHSSGARRFDAQTQPHDHFICNRCGGIRNIDISARVLPLIESALDGCSITGRLVIYGSCHRCTDKKEEPR